MTSIPKSNAPGYDGRPPTLQKVLNWEHYLMGALRDARHYVDWGTGSVMDHDPPPAMIKNKVKAHAAITDAEGFIEQLAWGLRDFLYADAAKQARADAATSGRPDPAWVAAFVAEARKIEAASTRMRELLAQLDGAAAENVEAPAEK